MQHMLVCEHAQVVEPAGSSLCEVHLLDNVPDVFIVQAAQVQVPLVGLCLCSLQWVT